MARSPIAVVQSARSRLHCTEPSALQVTAATPKAAMTGAAAVAAAQPKAAPKAAVVVPPPSRAKALEEATEPLEEANADVAEAKKGGLRPGGAFDGLWLA